MRVVPVTGRPAGWVDHIARMWPVDGVVGENGGLWFWMHGGRMRRGFCQPPEERARNREALREVGAQILAAVPGTALASDQPYRELDLAIDFTEDVPRLDDRAVDKIVALFHEAGATCKVSSIHVNGWFGDFDKAEGCRRLVADRFGEDLTLTRTSWIYVGDSANDEPMFKRFPTSFGVSNIRQFLPRMASWPKFISDEPGGVGFSRIIDQVLARRSRAG